MKKTLFLIIIVFSLTISLLHAQQSEFQGTWIGERSELVDRSAYKLEITGNRWQEFYNNQIEAVGTARFSTGRAELFLTDGRLAWDLRLLAPGLIEQPITWSSGLYRFRRVQPNSNSSNNSQLNNQNLPQQTNPGLNTQLMNFRVITGTARGITSDDFSKRIQLQNMNEIIVWLRQNSINFIETSLPYDRLVNYLVNNNFNQTRNEAENQAKDGYIGTWATYRWLLQSNNVTDWIVYVKE